MNIKLKGYLPKRYLKVKNPSLNAIKADLRSREKTHKDCIEVEITIKLKK